MVVTLLYTCTGTEIGTKIGTKMRRQEIGKKMMMPHNCLEIVWSFVGLSVYFGSVGSDWFGTLVQIFAPL